MLPQSTGLFFEQFRESQTPVCLQPLENILSKQPFLTGDAISAADIAVGANLLYLPMFVKDVRHLCTHPHAFCDTHTYTWSCTYSLIVCTLIGTSIGAV